MPQPPPKRLLVLVPVNLRVGGGQEQDILALAKALHGDRFQVHVVDFDTPFREEMRYSDEAIRQRLGEVPRTTLPSLPVLRSFTSVPSPRGAQQLRNLLAASDLVLTSPYYLEDLAVALLIALAGRPAVASQNNTFLHRVRGNPREALQDLWNGWVGIRLLRRMAGVRTVSQDERAQLVSLGVPRTEVLYFAPGWDPTSRESPRTGDATPGPAQTTDESPGVLRILVAGRMTFQKGFLTTAEILRRISLRPEGFRDYRFVFVGTDTLPPQLASWVQRSPDRISNLGFLRAGMDAAFHRADVLLMPSLYESLGSTAIRALREGVPVIASDIPGLREVVRPGVCGWLAPAQDVDGFLVALGQAHTLKQSGPEAWTALQVACRTRYREGFGRQAITEQYARFVDWLSASAGAEPAVPPASRKG